MREVRPDISISSDFIIGFPTETETDFQASMDLIEQVRFDHAYSFLYSKRPGTPAALLVDNVTQDEKQQRLQRLQSRISTLVQEHSRQMVGSVERVLVERHSARHAGQLAGRSDNGRWVDFNAAPDLIGQLVEVQITDASTNALRGRLIADGTLHARKVG
jgi:tRNA-2-methylthio-N6-dimethylallyladenosine synthase